MNYLNKLKAISAGHKYGNVSNIILKSIDSFITIDNPYDTVGGVYQIENFYIGKSVNFKQRLASHIVEMLGIHSKDAHINKEKAYEMQQVLMKRKLKVKILSPDQAEEKEFIIKKYSEIPLTNIEFVTDEMREERRQKHLEQVKGKKLIYKTSILNDKYVVVRVSLEGTNIYKIGKSKMEAQNKLKKYLNRSVSKTKKPKNKIKVEDCLYIAIKKGRVPGLYKQSEDWYSQINNGYKNPIYQGFNDIEKARSYLVPQYKKICNAVTDYIQSTRRLDKSSNKSRR